MSFKTVLVALLALVFGGSAALIVTLLVPRSSGPAKPDTEPVVVAALDVGRGIQITAEMVIVKQWPKGMIPTGAVRKLEDAIGQSTKQTMTKDEAVLQGKLSKSAGLNALVPVGMRAYTILTPSASAGVGGFIQPQDRVDVILTVTSAAAGDERRTGGGIATVLLQYVEVLAAGRSLNTSRDITQSDVKPMASITLLVTPRQAQELTLAQTKGTLNLALRSEGDMGDEAPSPLYLSDLPFMRERPNDGDEQMTEEPPPTVDAPEPVVAKVQRLPASQIRTFRGITAGLVVIQPAGQ